MPQTLCESRTLLCALLMLSVVSLNVWASTEPIPVRIAVSQSPLSTPFFVARDLGLFKKHGIEVEFVSVVGGHRAMREMLEGKADFATSSDMSIAGKIREGKEFQVLTTFVHSPGDSAIIGLKSRGVDSIEDLPGKKIGITLGTSSHYYIDGSLLLNGIIPNEVTLIPIAPERMSRALQQGEVDAISTWQPWAGRSLAAAGEDGVLLPSVNAYTLTFNLIAMRPHPAAEGIIRALVEAEKIIARQPVQAQIIVAHALTLTPESVRAFWDDYIFSIRLDQSLLMTLENEFMWLNNQHPPAKPMVNFLKFMHPGPLLELDAQRVSLIL